MGKYCKKEGIIRKNWFILDCKNKILGRVSSLIATIISGKNKPEYVPNSDVGDYVIAINAKKILVTGNKFNKKLYYYHTGYAGGMKCIKFSDMLSKNPEKIIKKAVKGMLPKNKLSNLIIKKLKVYPYDKHIHMAQKPKYLNLN